MRICLYTSTALPAIGGQELVVDALARQFTALGQSVVVLAPRPSRPWRLGDRALPYPVVRHPRFYSMRRWVEWYRRWLLRLHRRRRFDVIHCHGVYPTGYLGSLARPQLQTPVVITSHGEDVYEGFHRLAEPLLYERHRSALQGADALVAVSRFTRQGFERLCPQAHRIVDIPNGVDWEAFAAPAPRPRDLPAVLHSGGYALFIGRLVHQKGVDVLLRALALISPAERMPVLITGEGRERSALESLAVELELRGDVHFVGLVHGSKKAYLLQHARCLVVPSRQWEAFGLVVLEAYAAGCPVIASQLSGLADLIEPGRTGWLVPQDDPTALAAALKRALDARLQIEQFRQRWTHLRRQYAWREIAQRHLQLYEELGDSRAVRAVRPGGRLAGTVPHGRGHHRAALEPAARVAG